MTKFALLAAAALIASPAVFAADKDLCQLNLQEIDDNMATNKATLGDPARGEVQDLIKKARDAKQSGDTETCIAQSTKALRAPATKPVQPPRQGHPAVVLAGFFHDAP